MLENPQGGGVKGEFVTGEADMGNEVRVDGMVKDRDEM